MLPRADIITVNPVGRADPASRLEGVGDARQEAFQRSLAGLVGKSMQGEVLSRLTDGSFIVRVAGASARMLLPQGAKVGADIPLTLVSNDPRPTFQVATGPNGQTALAYAEAGPSLAPARTPLPVAPPLPGATPPGQEPALARPAAPPVPGQAAQTLAPPLSPRSSAEAGLAAALQARLSPAPGVQPPLAKPNNGPAVRSGDTPRTTSHAAALLGKAPLLAAEQLPDIDPESTPSTLSDTARVLANVLGSALRESAKPVIAAHAPLVATPEAPPEQVAAALKDAVAKSGLFYESHVAEWTDGKRTLAELAREPQMQRAVDAPPRAPGSALDAASAQLVNQQLATQEQARVAWQGQAWPGMPMQWEIQRDAPDGRGGAGDGQAPEPAWRSGVRFSFPLLGEVSATLVLVGDQLHIGLRTASADAQTLLRSHAGELGGALEAAGVPLSSLDIRAGGAAGDGHG
jgi:hypothetical protein